MIERMVRATNQIHSGPEKLKKTRQKKLVKSNKSNKVFREIAFLAVLNFFPVQKWNLAIFEIAKNGIWSKIFFVKLIYLISRGFFLDWTFNKIIYKIS